jgi:membrane dipeptidase
VVAALDELGILIDLSHVGARTTADAIEASSRPVVFSHVCPAALKPHPRNKTDDELRRVAERGGLVGVTPFPWFLRAGREATLDDFLEAVEHVLGLVGEDAVGIGTDFTQGHGDAFVEWIMRDKGTGRLVTATPLEELRVVMPAGLRRLEEWPNVTAAMERRGWPEGRIRKVLGENWLRVLSDVWRTV